MVELSTESLKHKLLSVLSASCISLLSTELAVKMKTHFWEWEVVQRAPGPMSANAASCCLRCQRRRRQDEIPGVLLQRIQSFYRCQPQSAPAWRLPLTGCFEEWHPSNWLLELCERQQTMIHTASCHAQVPDIRFDHTRSCFSLNCM